MEFVAGKEYKWSGLLASYGGSRYRGIAVSARTPVVFLNTGESGHQYGYADGFQQDGTFWYTGEGQVGDMEMVRGNRAIRNSAQDGRQLHLFEQTKKGYVRYVGAAFYVGHHETLGPDRNGDERRVIIFHLEINAPSKAQEATGPDNEESERSALWKYTLAELRKLAAQKPDPSTSVQQRQVLVRERSEAVKIYVRKRANGKCECCGKPAPFMTRRGHPYLEPHHISRLADGGPDHPAFVAAICPTCHKHIHYGKGGDERNRQLAEKIRSIEELAAASFH